MVWFGYLSLKTVFFKYRLNLMLIKNTSIDPRMFSTCQQTQLYFKPNFLVPKFYLTYIPIWQKYRDYKTIKYSTDTGLFLD